MHKKKNIVGCDGFIEEQLFELDYSQEKKQHPETETHRDITADSKLLLRLTMRR